MSRFPQNLDALDATEPYDVCVIGAGAAGSIAGLCLARAGLRVLLIEGASLPHGRVRPAPPAVETELAGDTYRPPRAGAAKPLHRTWTNVCERLDPADFRMHPYNRAANPWPLTYPDLEPHYRAAERMFRTRQSSPPPGRRLPARARQIENPAFEQLLRSHGVDYRDVALATPRQGESVFEASRELLPELLASRTSTLVSGITVKRLRTDGNGRVVGALCRTADGASKIARARTYVIAAGALETPRLLLLSRSQRFPKGLGNDHGRVGRAFHDHIVMLAYGRVPAAAHRWRASPAFHSDRFHQMFRREGLGAMHPFFEPLAASAYARLLRGAVRHTQLDAPAAKRRLPIAVSCLVEIKPADANRLTLSPVARDADGDPRGRLVFGYSAEDLALIERGRAWLDRWLQRFGADVAAQSELDWAGSMGGTCRMGTSPSTSVCDSTLRVHASPNLYLCGAATLPRAGAVPPGLTVAALAHRLADHLTARAHWCARTAAKPRRASTPQTLVEPIPLVRRKPQP